MRYQEPPAEGERRIGYVRGTASVLLSAPHAAVHTRRREPKEEEEFTAAMACLVAELTDAHALYARRRSPTDPGWYPDVPCKRRLGQIVARDGIQFVLDIHGMAPSRDLGIALGTMGGRSCPEQRHGLVRRLEDHGFRREGEGLDRLDVDGTFTGRGMSGQETVTSHTWQTLGVPCAQLELHPGLRVVERREDATLPRPFHEDPERIRRTVLALVAVVGALSPGETGDA
ncbi:MAG: hypothetical protein ACOC7N_01380 [Chloroflexota bacterium]